LIWIKYIHSTEYISVAAADLSGGQSLPPELNAIKS
jgi:hypothetical protein